MHPHCGGGASGSRATRMPRRISCRRSSSASWRASPRRRRTCTWPGTCTPPRATSSGSSCATITRSPTATSSGRSARMTTSRSIPSAPLLLDEQQSLVRRCSAVLTGRQRRALTLREVEGHSYAEIGSDLGIGTDAVAQVISRARVRLRVAVRRAHVDLDQLAPECRALLGPLSDYLDGHAAKSTPEIEAHLAECESCRDTLAAFQGAGSRLRGTLPLAPLAGILARVGEAVRFGSGAPADAVRAGAVVVAAAIAIGGGGTYAAHQLTSAAGPRAIDRAAPSHAPRATPASHHLAASAPRPSAAPLAVRGRRELGGSQPTAGGRHPRAKRTAGARPGSGPSVSAPTAVTPGSTPAGTPAPPASTPSATPVTRNPATATPPRAIAPPAVDPARATTPVTRAGNVTDPLAKRVVQPAVAKVVDPVVANVVAPVVRRGRWWSRRR